MATKKTQAIKMIQQLTEMQGISSVIQLLSILDLLAGSKEYHYVSSDSYNNPFNQHETERMNKVYEYVLKKFRQKILLEELADLLHMTPTSFSRYFAMKNNKPFSKFVSEIRIKHACKLLTETEDSIEQVCYECGFNTLSNFNKQFKDIMLKKPTQYKQEFLSL
jgi:transcriptional regulator GlxA family with amidase domain